MTEQELQEYRAFREEMIEAHIQASNEQAMAEIEDKIAQVKKNGTWDGIDVDEFMREVRGE